MDRYSNHTLDQIRELYETYGVGTRHESNYVDQDDKGRVTHISKYARWNEVIDQDETVVCHISPTKGGWEIHIYDTFNGSDVFRTFKRKWECEKFGTCVADNILWRYKML